jgi:DNA-binding NarL/FixJ family response regulator
MASLSAAHARRVLLANEPRLFREMLQRVMQNTPGLEVVGEVTDPHALRAAMGTTGAHWLVVSLTPDGELPAVVGELLVEFPSLCVLGVADDGSRAVIKWAEIHQESLNSLSLSQMIALLGIQSSLQLTPPYISWAGTYNGTKN